jgi:hypothetical protein
MPNYLDQLLIHRNPSRLFARSSEVPIATCRGCLFKTLCLENEKSPVIRKLVLGEEITDDDDQQDDFAAMMKDCGL